MLAKAGAAGGIPGRVLVFGGATALGAQAVTRFAAGGWDVVSLDFYDSSVECGSGVPLHTLPPVIGLAAAGGGVSPPSTAATASASAAAAAAAAAVGLGGGGGVGDPTSCRIRDAGEPLALSLPVGAPPRSQVRIATASLAAAGYGSAAGGHLFDAVLNATTGFAVGGIQSEDVFESMDFMVSSSLHSSVVTARLATAFLRPGGMLTFTGSVAALSPQPKLLAFAVGHAAVHQLVRSLAAAVGVDLPDGVTVVGVVPEVLDTAMHRQLNRGRADDNWTSCDVVAEKLFAWADSGPRPPNGALVSVTSTMVAEGRQEHAFRLINTPSYVQTAEY
ncbi:hypothetical protein MMPV_001463 [Pyropia vietnamensis]